MILPSFGPDLRAVVVGASGGIGGALVEALALRGEVTGLTRADLDLTDPASITSAAARIDRPLDLVIVATGSLGAPEKALRDLDATRLADQFAVNAIGPALVAQAFLPKLRTDRRTGFAVLSARVGSIADNRLGGWHAYRASKAALNQLVRTMAIEHARRCPLGVCVALHPGTVDTGLSAPFQRGVRELFTPAVAAGHLLTVLDGLQPADTGGFFAWDGSAIAF
ncbi:SDR family NAD(P)-dependent oxidoreductase [Glacieibacterium frigidum]|uniref:SDR family NAD(P)-dependent oxidoreductase n=1 Tax=Glacieibacterium frigidum TaxID=2593303 RepID=UPI001F415F13|nr:SDR family NAD(P)-dependent oxidoreductase [Glacieibacterium frigidum]